MTNIIRLNDSINDYAARPVITKIGEPDLVIRPATYLDALGSSTNIAPDQILIDGRFGQTTNPAPWLGGGVGSGTITVKSDADGAYLAMSHKGIRTGLVMDTRNDVGSLAIVKYRVKEIIAGATRLISIGPGGDSTANFFLGTSFDTQVVNHNSTYTSPPDDLVHTIAMYVTPNGHYLFEGNKRYSRSRPGTNTPNDLTGVGINTRSNTGVTPGEFDLYHFELYLDVSLTEQQITDYLKAL